MNANDLHSEVEKEAAEGTSGGPGGSLLLHEQHLAGALDGDRETPLVMSGKAGVLPGKDTTIFCDKLLEQGHVFKVDGIDGEIDFGFWTRNPWGIRTTGLLLVGISFAGHGLLNFAVDSVPTERRIELLFFNLFRLQLFVSRGLIARGGFALLSGFSAFDGDNFSGHGRRWGSG